MVNWHIFLPIFFTAMVEWVEAFTIVLAVAISIGWRAAGGASLAAFVALGVLTVFCDRFLESAATEIWMQGLIGVLLLLFGLQMVLGRVTAEAAKVPESASLLERAVYPLAIPGIAGAGSMLTVVLLTDNNIRSVGEQARTVAIMIVCLAIFFALFALSRLLFRVLGKSGIEIVSRVFGLILASIAVNGLVTAIKMSFGLT